MILFHSENTSIPGIPRIKIKNWIKHIIIELNRTVGDINFVFCDDSYILQLNKEYLKHNYFTDVITFNNNTGNRINGDIFISLDTVGKNAEIYDKSFSNELYRVVIHGLLHLIGFDDVNDQLQSQMTIQEDKALNILYTVFLNP